MLEDLERTVDLDARQLPARQRRLTRANKNPPGLPDVDWREAHKQEPQQSGKFPPTPAVLSSLQAHQHRLDRQV